MKFSNNVSVIGIGRLGLCFSLFLEKSGYNVIGVDVNEEYVSLLNSKKFTTVEPNVDDLLINSKNFKATTNIKQALDHSDLLFILVATPSLPDGRYDHSQIESVIKTIASFGKQEKQKHLIISSTTMPSFCDTLPDKLSGLNYTVSYNPEFIAQGTIYRDQLSPEFILIGEGCKEAGDWLQEIYETSTISKPVICRMKRTEAEICKISYNCFLTTKISFANMVGDIAKKSGVSPEPILDAIGCSDKVGHKYLKYGFGYGGPCFPRDNRALAIHAKDVGYEALISYATDQINVNHLKFQVEDFKTNNSLENPVKFDSVTYKSGTDILEESQQLEYAVHLAQSGYNVTIQETQIVIDKIKKMYGNLFTYEVRK